MLSYVNAFVFWIIALPFFIWQGRYEGPKVLWFLTGGFFLTLFWIIKLYHNYKSLAFSWIDFFYLLWLVILFVASVKGLHPLASIVGGSYRHQGVLFFLTLWLTGKTLIVLTKRERSSLRRGLARVVFLEAIIVILQVTFGKTYFGRPLGTLGGPNTVAGFLTMGLFFIDKAFRGRNLSIIVTLVFVAVLLTGSRAGIAGLLIMVVFFLLSSFKKVLFWKISIILGILALSGLVILTAFKQRPSSKFENRGLFWEMAISFIRQRPLLGYGAETQEVLYEKEFARQEMPLSEMMVDRSHNLFLDIILWSGFSGLALFLLWIGSNIRQMIIGKQYVNIAALFSWFVFSMFQPLGVIHWLLLILILV